MATNAMLFTGTTGLNNRLEPQSLPGDIETGIADIAVAINVDIDDAGKVSRRLGQEQLSSVSSHSAFCDGGEAFVAQDRTSDAALYQIGTDFSLTGIRSGLTKGRRISYCRVGLQTFYGNGVQNGVIAGGVSNPWPTNSYVGPDTMRDFSAAPVASKITFHDGRMFLAVGQTVYASEPYKPGLFNLAKCFFQFRSDVIMLRAVKGGIWMSDATTTGFISSAPQWKDYRFEKRMPRPAHEWSDCQRLLDLSNTSLAIPGLSLVWSCDIGLMVGTDSGQLINVTESKLIYPHGSAGAVVADGLNIINTVL